METSGLGPAEKVDLEVRAQRAADAGDHRGAFELFQGQRQRLGGEGNLVLLLVENAARAGTKLPNAFGLHDMHGNTWEWCQDRCHVGYNGALTEGSAWETGSSSYRVSRGGSWLNPASRPGRRRRPCRRRNLGKWNGGLIPVGIGG